MRRFVRSRPFSAASMFIMFVLAGLAVAQPSSAACAILDLVPLDRLKDGSLSDAGLSAPDRRAAVADRIRALSRIEATFGKPSARPVLIHLSRPDALWPLLVTDYGMTAFAGSRTCVVIGPDGRNVDVLAHELIHAEVADRLGFWRRRTEIPIWFDEGVGMQVDRRSAFNLPPSRSVASTSTVRSRGTTNEFFGVPPQQLTRNYADAKAQVAAWLQRVGRQSFYERLERIRRGGRFEDVWAG